MEEDFLKQLAQQLRKPEGQMAGDVVPLMNKTNAEMNLHSIEILNPQAKEHILEVGMGNGYFLKDILSKAPNIKYSAVDYSKEMVEQAKRLNKDAVDKGIADFKLGSAEKLDFEDNTFQKVLSVNTIYFWNNPARVFAEIKRVLKDKGQLLLGFRPKKSMQNYPFTKYNFELYSEKELQQLLEENDFHKVECFVKQEEDLAIDGKNYPMHSAVMKASVQK